MLIDGKRLSLRERFVKRIKSGTTLLIVFLIFPFVAAFSIGAYFRGYERSIKVEKDTYVSEYHQICYS